ncbi:hypothetical protein AKO1_007451 [Acrasis kona]|uniref:Uncharacterized protein n=1 Tax=Acrasis kona TaxID=1008807 RepID=A0AAW2YR54_9EUKA
MLRLFTQHINKCKQGTRFRAYAKFGFIKKHGEAVDITPEPVSVPVDNQTENDLRELSANLSEGLIKRLKTQFLGGGDLKDVKRKSNETLLKMVRESHKKAGVYTSTALITIFGALLYVVVVSSYFDETKNHIQTLLATILSPQEDFALFGASSAEELSMEANRSVN